MSVSSVQSSSDASTQKVMASIVMPCLNEEQTVGECVRLALSSMNESGISGEVIVVDNGSNDNSVKVAEEAGARVIYCPTRGYGNAIRYGAEQSYGQFIVMGDSDMSYDFRHVPNFIEKLSAGHDLVMGNRFHGGIAEGAMPWKNRYIGNPALSSILNALFHSGASDAHCGLRGFTRKAFHKMDLQCSGMEFASEIVVKATKLKLNICEIPTTLSPDGRGGRPPHLNPWRDGWRHLKFLLMASPLHLFLLPAFLLLMLGTLMLLSGLFSLSVSENYSIGPHWMILGGGLCLIGLQTGQFGILARLYSHVHWFSEDDPSLNAFLKVWNLERGLSIAITLMLVGFVGDAFVLEEWLSGGFGPLHRITQALLSTVTLAIGIQVFFFTFLLEILNGGQSK